MLDKLERDLVTKIGPDILRKLLKLIGGTFSCIRYIEDVLRLFRNSYRSICEFVFFRFGLWVGLASLSSSYSLTANF